MNAKAIAILEDAKLGAQTAIDQALSLEGLPKPLLRRFAAYCAAEALYAAKQQDPRSWKAVEVAIKISFDAVTIVELAAARDEARAAAIDGARDGALVTVGDEARYAAWSAVRGAPRVAARDTARLTASTTQRAKLLSMLRGDSDFVLEDLYAYNFKHRLKSLL